MKWRNWISAEIVKRKSLRSKRLAKSYAVFFANRHHYKCAVKNGVKDDKLKQVRVPTSRLLWLCGKCHSKKAKQRKLITEDDFNKAIGQEVRDQLKKAHQIASEDHDEQRRELLKQRKLNLEYSQKLDEANQREFQFNALNIEVEQLREEVRLLRNGMDMANDSEEVVYVIDLNTNAIDKTLATILEPIVKSMDETVKATCELVKICKVIPDMQKQIEKLQNGIHPSKAVPIIRFIQQLPCANSKRTMSVLKLDSFRLNRRGMTVKCSNPEQAQLADNAIKGKYLEQVEIKGVAKKPASVKIVNIPVGLDNANIFETILRQNAWLNNAKLALKETYVASAKNRDYKNAILECSIDTQADIIKNGFVIIGMDEHRAFEQHSMQIMLSLRPSGLFMPVCTSLQEIQRGPPHRRLPCNWTCYLLCQLQTAQQTPLY